MNSFPTDPALAQMQANALNGNALKSLREMSGAVTHAVWYFATHRDVLPQQATTAAHSRTVDLNYRGHQRARTR
jgi:hypothetical protein